MRHDQPDARNIQLDRNHGMDAIRALALLAGIGLHSTLSFLPGIRMVGMTVVDQSSSLTLAAWFYFVHLFRMPLFFLIAGYFAHLLIERKGLREFVRNRWRRVGIPLFPSWLCCYPILIVCALWSAWKLNTVLTRPELGAQPTYLRFPLMHLWFLYVLLQYYAVTVLVVWVSRKRDLSDQTQQAIVRRLSRLVAERLCSPFAPLVMAIIIGCMLMMIPDWFWWFGVPTPDRSLITQPAALLIYGLYYTIGWFIYAEPQVLKVWQREAWLHTWLGLGCYVACLTLVGVAPMLRAAPVEMRVAVYALMYGMGQWCLVVASMGWGLRLFAQPSKRLRYLADASYWMYLAHLPIVIFLQVVVMQWPLHWSGKFVLINGVTIGVLLAAYEWLVSRTGVRRKSPAFADGGSAMHAVRAEAVDGEVIAK